jgi:hypothetical protein
MTDYNGWTNRATWLVNLWMGGEDFIGQMQSARFSEIEDCEVARYIRDWVSHQKHYADKSADYGFVQDMACEDYGDINYDELAECIAEDINSAFV